MRPWQRWKKDAGDAVIITFSKILNLTNTKFWCAHGVVNLREACVALTALELTSREISPAVEFIIILGGEIKKFAAS